MRRVRFTLKLIQIGALKAIFESPIIIHNLNNQVGHRFSFCKWCFNLESKALITFLNWTEQQKRNECDLLSFHFINRCRSPHKLVAAVRGNSVTDIFGCLSFTFLWFTCHQVQCNVINKTTREEFKSFIFCVFLQSRGWHRVHIWFSQIFSHSRKTWDYHLSCQAFLNFPWSLISNFPNPGEKWI